MVEPADAQFSVSLAEERGGRTLRISLVGEVDHSNQALLAEALHEVTSTEAEEVVVDCRQLEFIDSAGLGVLAEARSAVGATRLEVSEASPHVERLLAVVGLR